MVVGTCLFAVGLFDYYFEGFGALVVIDLPVDLQVGLQVGLQVAQRDFGVLGLRVVEKVIDILPVELPESLV